MRILNLPELPFCPFVRATRWGHLVVNPYLSNQKRLVLLGEALYGKHWKRPLERVLKCAHATIQGWSGKRVWLGSEAQRHVSTDVQPPDAAINHLIAHARRRIREIEVAIEEAKLPPWIDG